MDGSHRRPPGTIKLAQHGSIIDRGTGERIAAKVQATASPGAFIPPPEAILKVGWGEPFFYEPAFQSGPMDYYFNELPDGVDTEFFIAGWADSRP